MTITYTAEVATSSGLGCFLKLLFRWKGSIYKLLWPNLVLYSVLYFSLSMYYRFVLSPADKEWFERLSVHCQTYGNLIPVSFVLGFYVSLVIKRWWDQYISIPWPDNLALFVSALVHGQDERGRLMRRTVMRYVNLSLVLTLRMVSPRVKMRFPSMDHLVEAGFLQPNEMKIFEDLERKTNHPKYWMPLVWASSILTRARKENRITNDFSLKTLIDELNIFRAGCGKLLSYDWISIPLVYTQVVTLAVYFYFIATLMGNQYLDVNKGYAKHQIDLVVPFFTFLEFFFYMGWLKVAESLVNPFGEDDDDFEVMWLIDRNLQMSYVIVDEMHEEHPEMLRDAYWDDVFPAELPYTAATKQFQTGPPQGSTKHVEVPLHMADFVKGAVQADDCEEKDTRVGDAPWTYGPVRMRRCSSVSVNSGQSGARRSRTSVLSVLTRAFHAEPMEQREDCPRDLEASGRSSGVSLMSRAGPVPTAPVSQGPHSTHTERVSASQDSSRITLVGSDFQEDVFHLSDISLATVPATADSSRDENRKSNSRSQPTSGPERPFTAGHSCSGGCDSSDGAVENALLNATTWQAFGQAFEQSAAPDPQRVVASPQCPHGGRLMVRFISSIERRDADAGAEQSTRQSPTGGHQIATSSVSDYEEIPPRYCTGVGFPTLGSSLPEDVITILAPSDVACASLMKNCAPSPALPPGSIPAVPNGPLSPAMVMETDAPPPDVSPAADSEREGGCEPIQMQQGTPMFPVADMLGVGGGGGGGRRGRDFVQLEPILEHVEEHVAGSAPDSAPSSTPGSAPNSAPGSAPGSTPSSAPRTATSSPPRTSSPPTAALGSLPESPSALNCTVVGFGDANINV